MQSPERVSPRLSRLGLTVAIVALMLVPLGTSQMQSGDLVCVTNSNRILSVNESAQTFATIGTVASTTRAVVASPGNREALVLVSLQGSDHVLEVDAAGAASTLVSLPDETYLDLEVDQDGSVLVVADSGLILRHDSTGLTTVASVGGRLRDILLDPDTGDYFVCGIGSGIRRVSRRTGTVGNFAAATSTFVSLGHDPRTGRIVGLTSGASNVIEFDRTGTEVRRGRVPTSSALWIDDETGDYYVGGSSRVVRVDRSSLTAQSTISLGSGNTVLGLTRFASRNVSGRGLVPGTNAFRIDLDFPDSPGAAYGAGLSTSMRPGIPVAGRRIDLFPGALFFLSASGGLDGFFTSNFVGNLSATGRATIRVTIPSEMPIGATLFVTANAANGTKPGAVDLGNTIGIARP